MMVVTSKGFNIYLLKPTYEVVDNDLRFLVDFQVVESFTDDDGEDYPESWVRVCVLINADKYVAVSLPVSVAPPPDVQSRLSYPLKIDPSREFTDAVDAVLSEIAQEHD